MQNLLILAQNMRADWDRRVTHDYRFWITNEIARESVIWQEGERDLEQILFGLQHRDIRRALEIGCGVGRMLPAAARMLPKSELFGVDVSPRAVDKARELLSGLERDGIVIPGRISYRANSGVDLSDYRGQSIDLVWSFAALPHTPTRVFAGYLSEIKRILSPAGCARLQIFIGDQEAPVERDTLRVRAYQEQALRSAVELAGLRLTGFTSVTMPLQELLEELNLSPVIITLEQGDAPAKDIEQIATELLNGESEGDDDRISCTEFEAWLALHYADRLYQDGEIERARSALEYVAQHCKSTEFDVRDILDKLEQLGSGVNRGDFKQAPSLEPQDTKAYLATEGDFFRSNITALEDRFPDVAKAILNLPLSKAGQDVEIKQTADGAVLWRDEVPLDHPEKPIAAAKAWVKRTLNDSRYAAASHIVVLGFGCGYHLEALRVAKEREVSCIEVDLATLRMALEARDLRAIIGELSALSVFDGSSYIGTRLADFDPDAEIVIRPQAVTLDGDNANRVSVEFNARRGLKGLKPRLAVLGPLQGGTLPIAYYTTSGLQGLGQKVRGIDVSAFNSGYEVMGSLLFNDQRQALCRQTYVEMISSVLLESLTEKPIDILICMAQAPISPRALTELRKRGVVTVLWFVEDYLRFTYWREVAKYYDYVFTIQKGECIEAIRKAGAANVHYLPPACDPAVHAPLNLSLGERSRWGSPISFVGAGYHNRRQSFASLSHLPFKIWGTEWPSCKPFDRMVQEAGRRLTPEEYIKIFNATDININLHSSNERDGVDPTGDFVNPRTFELAACGAFQLVDERSLLTDFFEPGKEIATFSSIAQLKDKIAYYIERPDERARIAEAGRARALRDHTYQQRLNEMLTIIYSGCYQRLKHREQESPWVEMIRRAEFDPELKERCKAAYHRGEEPLLDGLIADITLGEGQLSDTEQKLLFLFHVRKQIVRMEHERAGAKV